MRRLPILALAMLSGTFAALTCHADPRVEETLHAEISREGGLQMRVGHETPHRASVRLSWPGIAGQSHWDVPESVLEMAMPCSGRHEKSVGGSGPADCVDVVPELLTYNRKRREAIFAIAEDDGTNVPIAVLLVRLDSREVRLILEIYGSGMSSASLSPDGRYLAYAMGRHARGTCNQGSFPGVLDIVRKQELKLPSQPSARPVAVSTFGSRWTSGSHVIFDQNRWDCDDPWHLTGKRAVKLHYDVPGGAAAQR